MMKTETKTKLSLLLPAGACLALALLSGCATSGPTIRSHADAGVNYAGYKTFAVVRTTGAQGIASRDVSPMLMRQMREETAAAFVAKGLTPASEGTADLLVLVHGGMQDKLDVTDWGLAYGRFSRGYEIDQYKEGTVLIDVFDAKTRELVWRGSAVAEVGDTPKPENVKAAIDTVVARYPN